MNKKTFITIILLLSISISCDGEKYLDNLINKDKEQPEYIVIFGDIQYYTNPANIHIYMESLDWILQQETSGKNIKCVLHTGDITMNNRQAQWETFYQATLPLAQQIPYYSIIGDHDYTWYDGKHINKRKQTSFNDYVQFPLSMPRIIAWYEEGRMENVVVENTVQGQRLDILMLEFGPREEVVEWADAYVKSHPSINYILMTHEYLEAGGGRRNTNLKMAARLQDTTYTTPDELWDDLIRCNDNILCVLCGHVGGLYAVTWDTNDFGREIPQIQHNIQSEEYRFDNWIMMWEFPSYEDCANVYIINTKTGKYFNDQKSLFKFKYREIAPSSINDNREKKQTTRNNCSIKYRPDGVQAIHGTNGVIIMKDNTGASKIFYRNR